MGARGVEILASLLTRKLVNAGYVTSHVSVPDQDLSKGTLTFAIIPGTIEDIRFVDPKTRGTWRNAFPTGVGSVLNLRALEQGLEQMKRVPNQDVTMELLPGAKQNTSIVEIRVSRGKSWSFGVSADDGGMESTGKREYSVNLSLYNPTGADENRSRPCTEKAGRRIL